MFKNILRSDSLIAFWWLCIFLILGGRSPISVATREQKKTRIKTTHKHSPMLNLKWNTKSALYMQYQFGCRLNMWNQNKNTLYLFELNGDESGKNYGIAYNVDWVIRNGFVFELHILKIAPHRQWNRQQTTPNQNSNRVESEMEQHINNTKKLVHLNNSLSIVLQPVQNVWTVSRMSKYFILHDIVTYSHGLFWHFSFVVVWVYSAHSLFFVGYFWFDRNPASTFSILLLLFCNTGFDSDIIFNRFWNLWHDFSMYSALLWCD